MRYSKKIKNCAGHMNYLMIVTLSLILAWTLAQSVVISPSKTEERPVADQKQLQPHKSHANTTSTYIPASDNDPIQHSNHSNVVQKLELKADSGLQVYRTCSLSQSFSLTFDDGPTELSQALDKTLENSNLRGTFFINGYNFGCIYDHSDLLLQRFNKGHLIASHTWSHVHLNQGNYEQISRQFELLEEAMIKILGVKPLYFRPPYGEYNDIVLQVLKDRGYKALILWSVDSQDTLVPPPSPSQIIKNYESYPEKTIVLNHETHEFMVEQVIPGVIPKLKAKNFKLLPVADCLNLGSSPSNWYHYVQKPGSRDASWTCDGKPAPGNFD